MSAEAAEHRGLTPHRVEGLADAVFAIVLTLLVIDIHAPQAGSGRALASALGDLWPDFLAYGISFAVLAIMWFGHRMEFHYITRMDRHSQFTSLMFLGAVTLLPFSASLMGRNFQQPLAVTIFGLNLFAVTALRWWHFHHASTGYRLIRADTPPKMVRSIRIRTTIVPLLYLIACAISLLSIPLTVVLFLIIPFANFVPASMDPSLTP
ncbi:MAG: TMEM175 family protein [Candidatus Binataceae bacterium]